MTTNSQAEFLSSLGAQLPQFANALQAMEQSRDLHSRPPEAGTLTASLADELNIGVTSKSLEPCDVDCFRSGQALEAFTNLARVYRAQVQAFTSARSSTEMAVAHTTLGETLDAIQLGWSVLIGDRAGKKEIDFKDQIADIREVSEVVEALTGATDNVPSDLSDPLVWYRDHIVRVAMSEIDCTGSEPTLAAEGEVTDKMKSDFVKRSSCVLRPVLTLDATGTFIQWHQSRGGRPHPAGGVDILTLPELCPPPPIIDVFHRSIKAPISELYSLKSFWDPTTSLLMELMDEERLDKIKQERSDILASYVQDSVNFVKSQCIRIVAEVERQFTTIEDVNPSLGENPLYSSIKGSLLSALQKDQASILRSCWDVAEMYSANNPKAGTKRFLTRLKESAERATALSEELALSAQQTTTIPYNSIAELASAIRSESDAREAPPPVTLQFGERNPLRVLPRHRE